MALDELLSNRQHPRTLDELTEKVNEHLAQLDIAPVTRRCVEKDIQYLEYDSPWMVEIDRFPVADKNPETGRSVTRRCLCYKEPGFSIFKKEMTEEEKYLLSQVLSLLGQFDGLPEFEGLESLTKNLDIQSQRPLILLDKNPLKSRTSLFAQAYAAVAKEWTVNLHYHTFQDPATNRCTNRCIQFYPYLLKEYNRRWYLVGAEARDKKLLAFALDRINAIEPTPGIPFVKYEGDVAERYQEIVGVTFYEEIPEQEVLFWVSDRSKDYVLTKPIHESQRHHAHDESEYRERYPMLEGGAFFSIHVRPNYELTRELCSFGSNLMVLSPQPLQQEILNRIQSMSEKYSEIANIPFVTTH